MVHRAYWQHGARWAGYRATFTAEKAGYAIRDEPAAGSRVVIQAAGPSGCGYDRQV